ncbi:uncharacterized protein LOC100835775 isoform X3 [Brachypodium distachyon]|uniref:uncharacterized protein LOC100835775 isoform X3 n=1 Tax=Brachypodium distachyon TaxID=15368 RepID=UPI000D0CEB1F|nr:uncharacterized protein LOC100835775 isoform X3 [Brachypodium distachyon]|eukprot:XP_024319347.1 uncharacterized protein LOC100835775 isoform X3 [Brachypodium distachyon]
METAPRAALEAPPGQPRGGGFFSSPSGRIRRGRVVSAFVLVGGKVCTVCACRGEGSRGGRFLFGLTHIWSMAEYAHARLHPTESNMLATLPHGRGCRLCSHFLHQLRSDSAS